MSLKAAVWVADLDCLFSSDEKMLRYVNLSTLRNVRLVACVATGTGRKKLHLSNMYIDYILKKKKKKKENKRRNNNNSNRVGEIGKVVLHFQVDVIKDSLEQGILF